MIGSIRKRGKKYSVIIPIGKYPNGSYRYKWYSGYNTKKEAELSRIKLVNELQTNTYIEPDNITLSEYLDGWFESYVKVNLKDTTQTGYKIYIDKHIKPQIGHIQLQNIQAIHLHNFYSYLLQKGKLDGSGGLSGKSVVQIHRILSKAFKQAERLQVIKKNPCNYVDLQKRKSLKFPYYLILKLVK